MKLRDIALGTSNVKSVPLRLANAPALEDGEDWQTAADTVSVGIRPLTPGEYSEVLSKAKASAEAAGAKQWLVTDPLCELHLMVHLVAAGCVDDEKRGEPFVVGGAAEIFASQELAGQNLAYLAQQVQLHSDSLGPRDKDITAEQLIARIIVEAERPENAQETFFSRLRPTSQLNLWHSTAKLLTDLLTGRSLYFSPGATSTTETTPPAEPAPAAKPTKAKKGKRK